MEIITRKAHQAVEAVIKATRHLALRTKEENPIMESKLVENHRSGNRKNRINLLAETAARAEKSKPVTHFIKAILYNRMALFIFNSIQKN